MTKSIKSFSQRFAEVPPDQIAKINGVNSEGLFVHVGKYVVDTLEIETGDLSGRRDILDFGCGIGRVLLPLMERAPRANLVGFDVDTAVLESCRRLIDDDRPTLVSSIAGLPDDSFDLIFAISVFTHLDASIGRWLGEIRRLLRPGGRALLTYQDDTLLAELASAGGAAPSLERGSADRYVVGRDTDEGGAKMGTFFSTEKWEAMMREYFKVYLTAPRALFGHQSYSVVGRADASADDLAEARRREGRYRARATREYIEMKKASDAGVAEIERLRAELGERNTYIHDLHLARHADKRELYAAYADLEVFTGWLKEAEDRRDALDRRVAFLELEEKRGPVAKLLGRRGPPLGGAPLSTPPADADIPGASFVYFLNTPPFRIYRDRAFTLKGWAFPSSGEPVTGLRARVDENIFLGTYGLEEPTVVERHGLQPNNPRPGFKIVIEIPPGRHRLSLEADLGGRGWFSILTTPIWAVDGKGA